MRYVFLLAATTLVGCAIENELRYTATLESMTDGVVFTDDGLDSIAAMAGTTCTIDPRWGCPTDDVDLPTDGEQIVDHYAGLTLGRSAVGVHTLTGSAWDAANDLVLDEVRVARLTDRGRVVLAGSTDCALYLDDAEPVGVPASLCADDARASVDRTTGHLYVASEGDLLRVGADGLRQVVTGDFDRLARDATRQLTYVTRGGGSSITAIDDDGRTAWTTDVDVAVRSLVTRGDRGDVLVLGERTNGFGQLIRIDGATGQVRSAQEVPDGQGELAVSGNGAAIAIIRAEQVHYYALDVAGEQPVVDPAPPNCMTDWGTIND